MLENPIAGQEHCRYFINNVTTCYKGSYFVKEAFSYSSNPLWKVDSSVSSDIPT